MKKSSILSLLVVFLFAATGLQAQVKDSDKNTKAIKKQIIKTVHKWHKAASNADFDAYFNLMADDAIFIGTDPTENWTIPEFKKFAKPYFDSGKAWSFSAIDRNVYVQENTGTAWFDELLKTQMGICRGSGVLTRVDGKWKIHHYVLSMTIPNDLVDEVASNKSIFDEKIIADSKKN